MTTENLPLVVMGHLTIDEIRMSSGLVHESTIGGAAAYSALGGFLAGGDVVVISRVGSSYPLDRFRLVHPDGGTVDISETLILPGESTKNIAWYGEDGTRRWDILNPDTMHIQTPTPEDADRVERGQWVLVCPASLEQQEALVDRLRARGARIALDTEIHYLTDPDAMERLSALTSRVDCFLPSREHITHLTGYAGDDAGRIAELLDRFGSPRVVLKCGASGVLASDRERPGELLSVPGVERIDVIDPTGAGDSFDGGFLAGLSRGESVADAIAGGCVAASFVIQAIGLTVPAEFSSAETTRRRETVRGRVAVHQTFTKAREKVNNR
ncbi:carbohydrate kinase family protein [Leifsonia sp. NPDC056665]|uniref:carbohydrate kinase family protein n=1 Tax=Leifsonia sp. NPDC056665 TaxID=3345901 RepID=UPI00367B2C77